MHEAGVAARALEAAITEATARGAMPPSGVDVVFDRTRVTEDSLRFHLELALRDVGLAGLPVRMRAIDVACPACGATVAADGWPVCEGCGSILPSRTGPLAEARFSA